MDSDLVTITRQLIRDELSSLRRLAIGRRAASVRLPRIWRSALLHETAEPIGRETVAANIEPGSEVT